MFAVITQQSLSQNTLVFNVYMGSIRWAHAIKPSLSIQLKGATSQSKGSQMQRAEGMLPSRQDIWKSVLFPAVPQVSIHQGSPGWADQCRWSHRKQNPWMNFKWPSKCSSSEAQREELWQSHIGLCVWNVWT